MATSSSFSAVSCSLRMLRTSVCMNQPFLRSFHCVSAITTPRPCNSNATATATASGVVNNVKSSLSSPFFQRSIVSSLPVRSFSTGEEEKMIFSSFRVHKKATALDVSFTRPVVIETKTGLAYSLKRNGHLLITLAPLKSDSEKAYDWQQREIFALSVVEMGDLIVFHKNLQQNELKFAHENNLTNSKTAGSLKKELIFKRAGPWKGYTVTLNVTREEASKPVSFSIQVSEGEMQVLTRLMDHIIPNLLAFATPAAISPSLETQFAEESK